MYDIMFQGESARHYGLRIAQRPSIPAPEEIVEEYDIPGRGTLVKRTGQYQDVEIVIEFGFYIHPNLWTQKARECRTWLLRHGTGKLQFSDDPGVYWCVKRVEVDSAEREIKKFGRFEATFVCAPHQQVEVGDHDIPLPDSLYNPYEVSHPVYTINGNGDCTLTVNGKTMDILVAEKVYIDTDRMLAYRQDGSMQNTDAAGDYEDLYLQQGTNTLSVSTGFEAYVKPKWRVL